MAILAHGDRVRDLRVIAPVDGTVGLDEVTIGDRRTRLLVLTLQADSSLDLGRPDPIRAIPMAAHGPLRRALEAAESGLRFRAEGIDCAPGLFWAAGQASAWSTREPDLDHFQHLAGSLALGEDAPAPESLTWLLRSHPCRGLRAVSAVGRWREVPGTLMSLEEPIRAAAGALAEAGLSPDDDEIRALIGTAAALEGAGMRSTGAELRLLAGGNPVADPPVGSGAALREIAEMARGSGTGRPGEAALLPVAILERFLGADADAPYGRLRLGPTIPDGLEWFDSGGIRVGDSRAEFCYRRQGGHTFTMAQTDGSVPLNLVLDLGLPGEPGAVWIDGRRAEVEIARDRVGPRVRLQLPLDGRRVLRVEERGES